MPGCRSRASSKAAPGLRDASSRNGCATARRRSMSVLTEPFSRRGRLFMHKPVHVLDHPLVQHKLTLLRKKETSTTSFRRLLNEIGALMAYEVTREMPMHEVQIETPLESMSGRLIDGKKLVFVPIL